MVSRVRFGIMLGLGLYAGLSETEMEREHLAEKDANSWMSGSSCSLQKYLSNSFLKVLA